MENINMRFYQDIIPYSLQFFLLISWIPTTLLRLIISLTDSRLVTRLTRILCLARCSVLWLRSSTRPSTPAWSLCSDLRLYSFCFLSLSYRPVVFCPLSTVVWSRCSTSLRCSRSRIGYCPPPPEDTGGAVEAPPCCWSIMSASLVIPRLL